MQSHLWKLSVAMSTSKEKTVSTATQSSIGAGPINSCCHQGILNYSEQITLSMCRGTPKPGLTITEEQLQQQITMFKSLKSSWTNHSLCQMIFVKHKKAKQKMLPTPNHPCLGARTLSNTEACERTM